MRKYLLFISFLWSIQSFGQVVVQSNLPVAIGSSLSVTVSGKLEGSSSFSNEGSLLFYDTLKLSNYSGTGTISATGADQHLYLNGASVATLIASGGRKTLHSNLALENLQLSEAKIDVDTNRLLITSSITGYDSLNYIIGGLVRSGSDSLVYPIGNDTLYTPVTLFSIVGTTPAIGVQYVSADPGAVAGAGLLAVSDQKYWKVSEASGSLTSVNVQLPLIDETVISDISEASVAYGSALNARFRGLGQSSSSGTIEVGSIDSDESGGAGFYTIGKYFNELLREQDSLALVSIYESTNGDDWNAFGGWLTANLDQWARLTLSDKRVSALDLSSNNLAADFPSLELGLETLTDLNVSDNNLVSIGDLSTLVALQTVDVSNNRLQFGSLEALITANFDKTYGPQKAVLDRVRTLEEIGSVYTVDRTVTGTNNIYSWTKNGESISETSSSFDVEVLDFSADGTYVAEVTNSNVPGITLTTAPVLLRVSSLERDSTSLIAIYDSLNGSASSLSDWPNLPLNQWQEITLSSSRVTGISAANKGLSGALPDDILDIQSLLVVDFSSNDISGLPTLVGSLPNITAFNVSENKLTFEDLEPNAEFTTLNYADQQRFGQAYNDTLPVGSLVDLSQVIGGENNQYQWYYSDHNTSDQPISELNSAELVLDSLIFGNMGTYELRVINSIVPDLILSSEYQKILASADLTFVATEPDGTSFTAGEGYALQITAPGSPYDTVRIVRGDGFVFNDLVLGNYLIAVAPDNLDDFLPTYYSNTDLWTEADTLLLRYDRTDTLRMSIVPPDHGTVGAIVSGTIETNFGAEEEDGRITARRKVQRAGCSVRRFVAKGRVDADEEDGEFELYAYVQSDDEGRFEFTGLEDGLYRFNIEYPGIPMDEDSYVEFTIGEGGIEDEQLILEATITEDGIYVEKIEQLGFYRKYFKDLNIYPNPAEDYVRIGYGRLMSSNVTVRLIDLQGKIVSTMDLKKGDSQELELDVSGISGGIYILNFIDNSLGAKQITSFKVFVKR